jgi:hypothetical protein
MLAAIRCCRGIGYTKYSAPQAQNVKSSEEKARDDDGLGLVNA